MASVKKKVIRAITPGNFDKIKLTRESGQGIYIAVTNPNVILLDETVYPFQNLILTNDLKREIGMPGAHIRFGDREFYEVLQTPDEIVRATRNGIEGITEISSMVRRFEACQRKTCARLEEELRLSSNKDLAVKCRQQLRNLRNVTLKTLAAAVAANMG